MRSEVARQFAEAQFFQQHNASVAADYDTWLTVGTAPDCAAAVIGHRTAAEGPLFLERYLDAPIEIEASRRLDREIDRTQIVELGCLASQSHAALLALWNKVASEIGASHPVAVATLTAPLRMALRRIGVELWEIAPATKDRLGVEGDRWGSYYASDPVVCAGLIAQGASAIAVYTQARSTAQ
jgi:hypothetical protein